MNKLKIGKYNVIVVVLMLIALIHALFASIPASSFLNIQAIEIIVAGVCLSVIISFSFDTIRFTGKTVFHSFKEEIDYQDAIIVIYNYAIKVKKQGPVTIESQVQKEEKFIKNAMLLVCDFVKPDDMKDIFDKEVEAIENHLYKAHSVIKMIAQVAPAFGLIGTLIGMIGLLSHLNDTSLLAANMSGALVSTLYGAIVANFLAVPLMGRLSDYIYRKVLYYKIVAQGCMLIAKNDSIRNVFEKMNSMLPEDKRLEYPRKKISGREAANA